MARTMPFKVQIAFFVLIVTTAVAHAKLELHACFRHSVCLEY